MPWKLPYQKLDPKHETSVKLLEDLDDLLKVVEVDKWKEKIKELNTEAEKFIPRRTPDGNLFAAGKGGGGDLSQ